MIEITNLKVSFPSISFQFTDFVFPKNKITLITGRNGTGKTTLLKAVANLINYDGDIQIGGFVTYNSQEPTLFNRTVYENIIYPLKIRNYNTEDYISKINEYCELLSIHHLLDQNALKLSSGEKMKVSILRSLIFNPDVVLLDEPTTYLDLESISELIHLIKRLKTTVTFIIVSHNKFFVDELADHTYHLGGSNVYRKTN